TQNQIVAALITASVLLGFWFVGHLQNFQTSYVLRSLFGYLSFALHFADFIRGLVRTEAVTFYLVVGAIALTLNASYLQWRRRGEIALYTLGVVGVLIAMAYLSVLYPLRFDLTQARLYSLSSPTVTMLKRLDKPVHIVFFHDPMMRETVELYELIARQTRLVTVEFYDPMLNPAQARMFGVQFAGTAVMDSEGRKLQVSGDSETDIANGILRVSREATQLVCFLAGHGEADPFSLESHDHME